MPTITLREREWEVEITTNGGYERDTNSHVIEWEFVGDKPPTELTDAEEQSAYEQLLQFVEDQERDFLENPV